MNITYMKYKARNSLDIYIYFSKLLGNDQLYEKKFAIYNFFKILEL